jgi:hypothetical protein
LIRYVLRPALEGSLIPVIDTFLELKRPTVSEFIRVSDESVRNSLEPALRLLSVAGKTTYDYLRKVTELVQGRKGRSWLERIFNPKDDEEEEDADASGKTLS